MSRKEWKISGVFLGMIAFIVILMAVFMDENILTRIERKGTTIEDLKERDVRNSKNRVETNAYLAENADEFRYEMESRGFTVQDGKIVRKAR